MAPPDLTITPATRDDIPQLAALLHLLFTQEADFQPETQRQVDGLNQIFDSPQTGLIFVARSGPEIRGMVSLLFTVSTAEGGAVGWLEDMIVHPEHRGEGIGTRLLTAAIDYARQASLRRLTLLTDNSNTTAQQFYQHHGFISSAMTPLRLKLS
jgi:GNAT superfamily N-acetyltransferase